PLFMENGVASLNVTRLGTRNGSGIRFLRNTQRTMNVDYGGEIIRDGAIFVCFHPCACRL
ncbi:hypothetical protein, partial [Bartonella sp. AA81SXKL]|uniref:hypothetical protein n=1 Tax=Bartonella sp. AA81SXKL TaxID=3243438 RepID=UPI0035D0961E